MNLSSVIVFQIDVDGIAFDPTERNAPVSAGADRIAAFVAANECMKAEPRQIQSSGREASSSARRILAIHLARWQLNRTAQFGPNENSR